MPGSPPATGSAYPRVWRYITEAIDRIAAHAPALEHVARRAAVLGNGVVPQQAAAALRLLRCPHRWSVYLNEVTAVQ